MESKVPTPLFCFVDRIRSDTRSCARACACVRVAFRARARARVVRAWIHNGTLKQYIVFYVHIYRGRLVVKEQSCSQPWEECNINFL